MKIYRTKAVFKVELEIASAIPLNSLHVQEIGQAAIVVPLSEVSVLGVVVLPVRVLLKQPLLEETTPLPDIEV